MGTDQAPLSWTVWTVQLNAGNLRLQMLPPSVRMAITAPASRSASLCQTTQTRFMTALARRPSMYPSATDSNSADNHPLKASISGLHIAVAGKGRTPACWR